MKPTKLHVVLGRMDLLVTYDLVSKDGPVLKLLVMKKHSRKISQNRLKSNGLMYHSTLDDSILDEPYVKFPF